MTKNGIGVGQGLNGELLTELRVLLNTEWGHCGGPTCPPEDELPLLEERPFRQGIFDQPLTFFPDNPANKYLFDWYVDSNFYISMKGYLIKVSSYISVKYIVILFKISSRVIESNWRVLLCIFVSGTLEIRDIFNSRWLTPVNIFEVYLSL